MCAAASVALSSSPAMAGEVFGGLYVHGVNTPLTLGGDPESGADVQLGYRANSVGKLLGMKLEPYLLGQVNSNGNTSFAAVGISTKFGDRFYFRPGVGLAIHTGSAAHFDNPFNHKIEFGSRVLFEPEIGVGIRLTPRLTAEASWVHLSHGTLFGRQNPGIDTIGARLNLKLP
jgi:hypothetical protein